MSEFELSPRLKAIVDGFGKAMEKRLQSVLEDTQANAFTEFSDYLKDSNENDSRMNVINAAHDLVHRMLEGDPLDKWMLGNTVTAPWNQKIRDRIWEKYADDVVRISLETKDKEIARLNEYVKMIEGRDYR